MNISNWKNTFGSKIKPFRFMTVNLKAFICFYFWALICDFSKMLYWVSTNVLLYLWLCVCIYLKLSCSLILSISASLWLSVWKTILISMKSNMSVTMIVMPPGLSKSLSAPNSPHILPKQHWLSLNLAWFFCNLTLCLACLLTPALLHIGLHSQTNNGNILLVDL